MDSTTENNPKQGTISSISSMLNFIATEKVTVSELLTLLPHLVDLQKIQAPNIKTALDALRDNQNFENETFTKLHLKEIEILEKHINEAKSKEDKDYWTEKLMESVQKHIDKNTEMSDKNKKMWVGIFMVALFGAYKIFSLIKR